MGDERVEEDQATAYGVAELCGRLPLALRVVAERAHSRPHLSLRALEQELLSEQTRLDALAREEDELLDVRACFSWSYRALPPEQQQLFRLLGLHPGSEFSSEVASVLADVPVRVVREQLRELLAVHLVQETARDRFRLHDLLKAYAAERTQREDHQRERTQAVRRMFSWYLASADAARRRILPYSHEIPLMPAGGMVPLSFDAVEAAFAWFETERTNLLGVIQQALDVGQYDVGWKLPVVADGFFELRSYWAEWESIHVDGLSAAETSGDSLGIASNLLCLGDVRWRSGDQDAAVAAYCRCAELARVAGDRWLEGFAIRGRGLAAAERGDLVDALALFGRALDIFRNGVVRRGEGMALLSLGQTHLALGHVEEAVRYGSDAVAVFQEIGDRWSEAWGSIPLGEAYARSRMLDEAAAILGRAVAAFEEFEDRRSEALALNALGDVALTRSDVAGARAAWSRAGEIFASLHDPHAQDVDGKLATLPPPPEGGMQ